MDLIDGSLFWEGGGEAPVPPPVVVAGPGGFWPDEKAWNDELNRRWREMQEKRAIQDDDEEFIVTHLNEVEEEVYA